MAVNGGAVRFGKNTTYSNVFLPHLNIAGGVRGQE
jgi:hypothetical protein